jgi:glucosyl-dolichyl phosphate glucuronosyltransferase
MTEQMHTDHLTPTLVQVSVVICAYTEKRWQTMSRAIRVTSRQLRPVDELILVIDYNPSLLSRCIAEFPQCKVVPNTHPQGLSGARNTGLEHVSGSIVVFLDDDAVPASDWLDTLLAPYSDHRIRGVGGHARPKWIEGRPDWFPDEFLWVVGCSHRGLPSKRYPVRNLLGATMSFRRDAFDEAGGFDERMGRVGARPVGCGETEFSIRLTDTAPDSILLYEPGAVVEQDVPGQRGSFGYFVHRCWLEGVSKADVARRVGSSKALSSERHYARRVLPTGVCRGVLDALGGDVWGIARSLAIIAGLAVTTAGYGRGVLSRRRSPGTPDHRRCRV